MLIFDIFHPLAPFFQTIIIANEKCLVFLPFCRNHLEPLVYCLHVDPQD